MKFPENGACQGVDPDLFFPIGDTGPALEQTNAAKAVCGKCTARAACLEWLLESPQQPGVWAGLDERQQSTLRQELKSGRALAELAGEFVVAQ